METNDKAAKKKDSKEKSDKKKSKKDEKEAKDKGGNTDKPKKEKEKKDKDKKKDKKDKAEKREAPPAADGDGDESSRKRLATGNEAEVEAETDLLFDFLDPDIEKLLQPEVAADDAVAEAVDMETSSTREVDADSAMPPAAAAQETAAAPIEFEEADFWDSMGNVEVKSPDESPTAEVEMSAGTLAEGTEETVSEILQVPSHMHAELSKKISRLARASPGTRLILKADTLHITGPAECRLRASQYAEAVMNKHVAPGSITDTSVFLVLPDWAESWSGQADLEEELNVVVILEQLEGRTAVAKDMLAGYKWSDRWQPVKVLGRTPGGMVRAAWCYDGEKVSEEGIPPEDLQCAVRVAVCGRPRDRAVAVARILSEADQYAVGVMDSQVFALMNSRSDPISGDGCEAGPGGDGLEAVELNCNARTVQTIRRREETSGWIKKVQQVSKCAAFHFFQRPKWAQSQDYRGQFCALVVGKRHERWLAREIMKLLLMHTEAGANRAPIAVSPALASDCELLRVPKTAMGAILGKFQSNIMQLMKDTGTIIIKTHEASTAESERPDEEEVEDFLANMHKVQSQEYAEFAIFGPDRSRWAAAAGLLACVERTIPDYLQEEVDEQKLLGLDRIRFEADFEEDTSSTRADLLAGACGCHVTARGKVLMLVGTAAERRRGREYARFLAGKQSGKDPHVDRIDQRKDIKRIKVEGEAAKSRWLKEELRKLCEETKTCAFFDDWRGPGSSKERRLVLAGRSIEAGDPVAAELVGKTEDLVKRAVDWIHGRYKPVTSSWWSETSTPWWKKKENNWWDQSKESDSSAKPPGTPATSSSNMPPPATPAGRVPPPSTPGGFAGSTAPPMTPGISSNIRPPSTPGVSSGIAPPATPAGPGNIPPPATPGLFGPHGSAAPHTPAPGGSVPPPATPMVSAAATPGRSVPPPATPMVSAAATPGRSVPPPATPMVSAAATPGRSVPPPATPMVSAATTPGRLPPPATPMVSAATTPGRLPPPPATPANFGPHGSAAPATPAAPGGRAPATPASFGPHGSAAPSTPAPNKRVDESPQNRRHVPPPQTPGAVGWSASAGTPAGLPPPQTPAAFAGNSGANARTPAGLSAPQTPAALLGGSSSSSANARTPAGLTAPQTPAALLGSNSSANVRTPAGLAAPQTPAALLGSNNGANARASASGGAPPKDNAVAAAPGSERSGPRLLSFSTVSGSKTPTGSSATTKDSGPRLLSFSNLAPAQEAPLPPGWQKCISKSNGKPYYFNAKLKQSQYDRPKA
eukprot:TRINITY_DN3236_c0_g1_i3.p1 TRINITY_DN3236_c0_g1~~TRINITY_DN3236_c0_g1_i3.p1  ORF type:complete len:1271 (+),score=318.17 TRINITY_DN3236_c0_g1_i3:51-3863(+)